MSEGNDLKGFPIEHARLRSLREFYTSYSLRRKRLMWKSSVFFRYSDREYDSVWLDSPGEGQPRCSPHLSILHRSDSHDSIQLYLDFTRRPLSYTIGKCDCCQ